ncbi:MAG: PAS domain S-box protein [Candidatus Levybacteria bacterium]|nr:PAS domain S-box protein [Candidatus Levybacteria bacterium]
MPTQLDATAIYLASLLTAIVSNSVLVIFLLRRSERSVITISFSLFLLLIAAWGFPQFFINSTYFSITPEIFEILNKISALGYVFLPSVFLLFSLSFTDHAKLTRSILFWIVVFIPSVIFLFISWTTNLIVVHRVEDAVKMQWGYDPIRGPLFSAFLFWFEVMMAVSIAFLIQRYRAEENLLRKRQVLLVLIAILIPFLFGSVTDGFLPIAGISLFPSAVPLTSITGVLITFAMYRYGLFELNPITILSSIGDGMITLDRFENITHVNKAAEEMLGIHHSELLGKSIDDVPHLLPSRKEQKLDRHIVRALQDGKRYQSENYAVQKGRKKRLPISLTVSPVFSGTNIMGATVIMRDITREKVLERNKDDFISYISHELKTPITSIKVYNQMLGRALAEYEDKQLQRISKKLDHQINRLSSLLNSFLELSRLQSGKIRLTLEAFDIEAVIKNVIDNLQTHANNHKIILEGKLMGKVVADRDKVEEVLINLINNAIKYSPNADRIIVKLSKQGKRAIIGVRDFGVGIPKEYQKKIFTRFFQVHDQAPQKESGMGMGLYIASEIIRQHNGRIWVESSKGRGSTFYFTLPLK